MSQRSQETSQVEGMGSAGTPACWLAENDKEDIAAMVGAGLTTADEIEQRATSALGGFVGGRSMLLLNLADAVLLARNIEPRSEEADQAGRVRALKP